MSAASAGSAGSAAQGFKKLGEEVIYSGAVITVARGRFVAPDGQEFDRDLVHHPGAVVVVPLVDDRTALLVRQYRSAVETEILEIPAGKRDVADEPTEVTAARELAEEVGRAAGRLELLAEFYNSPGFSNERTWLYLARDLSVVPVDRQGVEEQAMTVEEVKLADVDGLIAAGELTDAKSIIGLTLAMRRLGV
ncbi:MAG TPA: NUDIX hydrolase [Acidimicrobiales bacterium]|nr:NUDIX hydrolase [Acidimicrobiales bacterium]